MTPSPKPFSDDPNAPTLRMLPRERWSTSERALMERFEKLSASLLDVPVAATIAVDPTWPFAATYGDRRLTFNKGRLGAAFFDRGITEASLSLLIHELAHHYASDHLSEAYYDALSDLGARLALAAARDPSLLA